MMFEVVIVLVLIIANGLFSMAEIALVSARRARLKQRADAGDTRARTAMELMETPGNFLATVQIGITLIGIMAGAFGGATLTDDLAATIARVPWLAVYAHELAFVLVIGAITYLSLVVGELAPKQLAMAHAEQIATTVAKPMRLLSRLASAPVRALSASANALVRLMRLPTGGSTSVTPEELLALIDEGTEAGVIAENEGEILERALRLNRRRVDVMMTPRAELVYINILDSDEKITATISENGYSWFPVGEGSLDNLIGVVDAKRLLTMIARSERPDVHAVLSQPVLIPEGSSALHALGLFRRDRVHLGIVVDEYGAVQGLLTLHDMLEAIIGDLELPMSTEEPEITRRADGSLLIDGAIEMEAALAALNLPTSLHDSMSYHTLGGFVMTELGSIPHAADSFLWQGFRFEVVDMDGRRVDKVLVMRLENEGQSQAP